MSWQKFGNCKGVDPDVFYPEGKQGRPSATEIDLKRDRDSREQVIADRYCNGRTELHTCPVRTECLEDAMFYRDDAGVRGGKTGSQRVAIRRKRLRAKLKERVA